MGKCTILCPLALGVEARFCLPIPPGTLSLNSRSKCILVSIRMIAPCKWYIYVCQHQDESTGSQAELTSLTVDHFLRRWAAQASLTSASKHQEHQAQVLSCIGSTRLLNLSLKPQPQNLKYTLAPSPKHSCTESWRNNAQENRILP